MPSKQWPWVATKTSVGRIEGASSTGPPLRAAGPLLASSAPMRCAVRLFALGIVAHACAACGAGGDHPSPPLVVQGTAAPSTSGPMPGTSPPEDPDPEPQRFL